MRCFRVVYSRRPSSDVPVVVEILAITGDKLTGCSVEEAVKNRAAAYTLQAQSHERRAHQIRKNRDKLFSMYVTGTLEVDRLL